MSQDEWTFNPLGSPVVRTWNDSTYKDAEFYGIEDIDFLQPATYKTPSEWRALADKYKLDEPYSQLPAYEQNLRLHPTDHAMFYERREYNEPFKVGRLVDRDRFKFDLHRYKTMGVSTSTEKSGHIGMLKARPDKTYLWQDPHGRSIDDPASVFYHQRDKLKHSLFDPHDDIRFSDIKFQGNHGTCRPWVSFMLSRPTLAPRRLKEVVWQGIERTALDDVFVDERQTELGIRNLGDLLVTNIAEATAKLGHPKFKKSTDVFAPGERVQNFKEKVRFAESGAGKKKRC